MIEQWRSIFENKTHGYSDYKKEDMRSGYGKLIGGATIGLPGMLVGHYIGKSTGSEKDNKEPIDERKKSHRFGVISSEMYRGKRMGKYAGIGAGAGAALGATLAAALAAKHGHDIDPEEFARVIGTGTGAGALTGITASSMVGAHKAAKKLGYGKAGRIIAPVLGGAFTGLAKPKQIKDEEDKHSKK